jgi:hypothetical protein
MSIAILRSKLRGNLQMTDFVQSLSFLVVAYAYPQGFLLSAQP